MDSNTNKQQKQQKNFIKSYNIFSFHNILTPLALYVYFYISNKPQGWQLNIRDISNHFKEGDASIYRAVNMLIRFGYIKRKRKYKQGFYKFYSYKIKKIEKPGSFTMLPCKLLNDYNVSVTAKHIYNYILSKPKNWIFYIYDIKRGTKLSKNTIYKGLQELISNDYLNRERVRDKGKFAGFHYEPLVIVSNYDKAIFNKSLFAKFWSDTTIVKKIHNSPYPKFANNSYIKFLKRNNINKSKLKNHIFNYIYNKYPKEKKGNRLVSYRTFKKHIDYENIDHFLKAFKNYSYSIRGKDINYIKYMSNWIKEKDSHNWRCYIDTMTRNEKITDKELKHRDKKKFKDKKKQSFNRVWVHLKELETEKTNNMFEKGDSFEIFSKNITNYKQLDSFNRYINNNKHDLKTSFDYIQKHFRKTS